jgi:uridine kinase
MQKPYIIGITGGSASGKTLFLKRLLSHFSENEICLISQDNYYKPIHLQIKDENGIENFDIPESIDVDRYAADIQSLRDGKDIHVKEYTFNKKDVVPKMLKFLSCPIIVVEGIFVFHFLEIAHLIDLRIFIDAKNKIKLDRRINRDNIERGYDLTDVLYRWENHVTPTYKKYIRPYKKYADIVIPNNNNFDKGLEVICHFLKSKIILQKEIMG